MEMTKKLSRGVALVLVVLIVGLLVSSTRATTIEQEIWVSPGEPYIYEFSVEKTGTIYAEARLEEKVKEPFLLLEFLSTGEIKEKVWGKSYELLTLSYDISEEDLVGGTIWKISVGSGAGEGRGYMVITYPSDTTPPTLVETTPTGEDVPVTTGITISFSEQMDEESAIGAFSIYPEVLGEFYWKENTMIFTPSFNLNYDTTYTVVIGTEAKDTADNNLEEQYEWSFRTITRANNPPSTPLLSGPTSGYIGTSYRYSISAEDPDGDDIKYAFDWGDDTTSETEFLKSGEIIAQSHAWDEPGEYHIRVRATDENGASSRWSELLIVVARTPLIQPTAIISATSTEINEGESVSFSAEASSDQDGSIVSYDWDFGDGYTDAGINVEHAYSQSGYYTATLTVTDNDGLSDSNRIEITANPLALNVPPTIPMTWILAAIVLVISAPLIIRMAIRKPSQLQINIETRGGIESMHEPELQQYTINVEVRGGIERL